MELDHLPANFDHIDIVIEFLNVRSGNAYRREPVQAVLDGQTAAHDALSRPPTWNSTLHEQGTLHSSSWLVNAVQDSFCEASIQHTPEGSQGENRPHLARSDDPRLLGHGIGIKLHIRPTVGVTQLITNELRHLIWELPHQEKEEQDRHPRAIHMCRAGQSSAVLSHFASGDIQEALACSVAEQVVDGVSAGRVAHLPDRRELVSHKA